MQNHFYEHFLGELKALDDFLLRRAGAGAAQAHDPDVRRLMEAVAFFSARTRALTLDSFQGTVHRLAQGHLDMMLAPQPARALIQAHPSERLTAPVTLPRGSEVRLEAPGGGVGLFTTTRRVTLLPLSIDRAELRLRRGGGFRLALRLRSRIWLESLPEPLRIFLDYLGDYERSAALQYLLREHLEATSVFFEQEPDPVAPGEACEVRMGALPEDEEAQSPLDRIRAFFHAPRAELFVNVSLPAAPRPWRQAWLCFDLDERWPGDLALNQDAFRLFVVPVENLRRAFAEPLLCDGTQDGYPIRAAEPGAGAVLHSVLGVYQETEAGMEPILPVQMASGRTSYQLERAGDAANPQHRLLLTMPEAFLAPRPIAVEALWYQPWFDAQAIGRVQVALQTRHVEGVRWELAGRIVPHRISPLAQNPLALLHVLALRSQPVLGRGEILRLMEILGADQDSHHAGLGERIAALHVHEAPTESSGGGLKYVYQAVLRDVPGEERPRLFDFITRLWMLLDAWSERPVELALARQTARTGKLLTEGHWS